MNSFDKKVENIKEDSETLRKEVRKQTIGYVLAAFGLVAGLAWNDAIKALIDHLFPASSNGLIAQFAYAIGITIVVVAVSIYLARLMKEEKSNG